MLSRLLAIVRSGWGRAKSKPQASSLKPHAANDIGNNYVQDNVERDIACTPHSGGSVLKLN